MHSNCDYNNINLSLWSYICTTILRSGRSSLIIGNLDVIVTETESQMNVVVF